MYDSADPLIFAYKNKDKRVVVVDIDVDIKLHC